MRVRHGSIFVVAMLAVMALSSLVLVLCRSMSVEATAAANQAAVAQAGAVERGAEQYILGILSDTTQSPLSLGEDNFAAVPVGEGYFWIVRPDYSDTSLPVYGLVDECSKLDINAANAQQLLSLPGMTDDVAAAIVDWRDADDDVSASGAESSYYLSLPNPYSCKNSPFETVEELLLVRGVTPQLLYGDGSAPPAGSSSNIAGNSAALFTDAQVARGIYDLLTIYSTQPNTAADGTPRVNLNSRNQTRTLLAQKLGEARANQIMALVGRAQVADIFDFAARGQLTSAEFQQVADNLTANPAQVVRGTINVNTAPREVLLTLGISSTDADKLLSQRSAAGNADSGSIAWVYDALGIASIGLGERITGRSTRYSADIVAASGNGRAFKRVRIVVDAPSGSTPRIIYRRDLSDRGWPMDPQILSSLRTGQGAGAFSGAGGIR